LYFLITGKEGAGPNLLVAILAAIVFIVAGIYLQVFDLDFLK